MPGKLLVVFLADTNEMGQTIPLGNRVIRASQEQTQMNTITVRDGTTIYYKDWGSRNAQPIVFHHGWPLSADDWDTQMLYFLEKGYRVIAHDRRGHGRSSQVRGGHDMGQYAH